MGFFNRIGKIAIGSRLRLLTEKITEDAAQIFSLYDIALQPKWFPVFYVISLGEQKTITEIAKEIGHSHPSVSTIIAEMSKKGLVKEEKDKTDGRRNLVKLSEKGKEIAIKIQDQYLDLGNAIEHISQQTHHDLWKAIEEWEYLLAQKSLLQRVKDQQKQRESQQVEIIAYTPFYKDAYKALNEEWISAYFKMEEKDYEMLDNPETYVLANGGFIFVALYSGKAVGVCALLKRDDEDYPYELAKMAVSPAVQGKKIGFLLAQTIIEKAKTLGAAKLYLESNTLLKPAINLYHKLGFTKIGGRASKYERVNIQMELLLQ